MKNSVVCIDANIIIWALIPAPLSESATDLLARWRRENKTLIAPALFAFEVTSTLRRLVFLQEITAIEGAEAFNRFMALQVRLSHRRSVFPIAWELASELNLSRAYDTAYLALAQLRGCDFWTADERLFNATRNRFSWVKWIGNYPAPR